MSPSRVSNRYWRSSIEADVEIVNTLNTELMQSSILRRPKCSANTDAAHLPVKIGYYNMGGASRPCDAVQPENLAAGALTHINIAFEYVSDSHEITDTNGPMVARVSRLKKRYPGLRVNIALGGWNFNDPPTQFRFSKMVATHSTREVFITSLTKYLERYALNGVDIG